QAQGEISPGKDIDLRCTTAGSTSPCLGHNSFAVDCPLAVLGSAFYPVPVRRPAASLPASFTPASRSDALRFASLAVTSSREDFHLLVNAHAGHTANGSRECAPDDGLREAIHSAACGTVDCSHGECVCQGRAVTFLFDCGHLFVPTT